MTEQATNQTSDDKDAPQVAVETGAVAEADDTTYDEREAYGWEFHKLPLLIAAVLTVLFYAFVFFYVKY